MAASILFGEVVGKYLERSIKNENDCISCLRGAQKWIFSRQRVWQGNMRWAAQKSDIDSKEE